MLPTPEGLYKKLTKLQKVIHRRYDEEQTVKYLLKKEILASKVYDPTDKVVSIYVPQYQIKGFVKYRSNDEVNDFWASGDADYWDEHGHKEHIPELIMLSISKEIYNALKQIVEYSGDYSSYTTSDGYLRAESHHKNISLTFRKHFLKGYFIFLGEYYWYYRKEELPI